MLDARGIANRYASGLFPMDEAGYEEIPWWTVDPRAVFALDPGSLAAMRRRLRRSLAHDQPHWRLTIDEHFDEVIERCGRPRAEDDGVWLSPRMHAMYRTLHDELGLAHTFELVDGDELLGGIVGVVIGRAAMLESMCHTRPHAGNVMLMRTLESLASLGAALCDIQTATDHTRRLGAIEIPREEYERRLAMALRA